MTLAAPFLPIVRPRCQLPLNAERSSSCPPSSSWAARSAPTPHSPRTRRHRPSKPPTSIAKSTTSTRLVPVRRSQHANLVVHTPTPPTSSTFRPARLHPKAKLPSNGRQHSSNCRAAPANRVTRLPQEAMSTWTWTSQPPPKSNGFRASAQRSHDASSPIAIRSARSAIWKDCNACAVSVLHSHASSLPM